MFREKVLVCGTVFREEGSCVQSGGVGVWGSRITQGRENNYLTELCSGSEAGSYRRLIDFVYHSVLGLRVINQKKGASACTVFLHTHEAWRPLFSTPNPNDLLLHACCEALGQLGQDEPASG